MKITVDVRDGLDTSVALARLGAWYAEHSRDTVKTPLTGVVGYRDGMMLFKRDYRKNDCFVIFEDAARKKAGLDQ
jgi:hypothetical protein